MKKYYHKLQRLLSFAVAILAVSLILCYWWFELCRYDLLRSFRPSKQLEYGFSHFSDMVVYAKHRMARFVAITLRVCDCCCHWRGKF